MEPTSVLAMRTEQTTRLMISDRLPPHKERFQDHYCRPYQGYWITMHCLSGSRKPMKARRSAAR